MMKITHYAITDTGLKRAVNEDSYCVLPGQNLFLVSDGMGGHAGGRMASQMTTASFEDFFKSVAENKETAWPSDLTPELSLEEKKLVTAIRTANQNIHQKAQDDKKYSGMGATVVATLLKDDNITIAHVGDSRAYRIRDNVMDQMTTDHSWVREQVQKGLLSEEEGRKHKLKNIITRALGSQGLIDVDVVTEKMANGDCYLLCSDGLSSLIDDHMVKEITLNARDDLALAGRNLVDAAKQNGGDDNITIILLHITKE